MAWCICTKESDLINALSGKASFSKVPLFRLSRQIKYRLKHKNKKMIIIIKISNKQILSSCDFLYYFCFLVNFSQILSFTVFALDREKYN